MSQRIITGFFDKRSDATEAIDHLVEEGIPRTSIRLMPENETASASTTGSYDVSRDENGFWGSLRDLFFPEEDRYTYAEAMNRGSIMVSVTVDEVQTVRTEDILNEHNTVDIDEREASWRQEGWSGYAGTASASAGRQTPGEDEVIPVVEEQLKVGKRQVSGGRVKVRSYVVETPVSEQVSLRDETVRVERRPVDRAVTDVNHASFQDRIFAADPDTPNRIGPTALFGICKRSWPRPGPQRSSLTPLNEGCRTFPSPVSARYSTSAKSSGLSHRALGFLIFLVSRLCARSEALRSFF
jgi:hypothetical protein